MQKIRSGEYDVVTETNNKITGGNIGKFSNTFLYPYVEKIYMDDLQDVLVSVKNKFKTKYTGGATISFDSIIEVAEFRESEIPNNPNDFSKAKKVNLFRKHDYSVVDVTDKYIIIENPWDPAYRLYVAIDDLKKYKVKGLISGIKFKDNVSQGALPNANDSEFDVGTDDCAKAFLPQALSSGDDKDPLYSSGDCYHHIDTLTNGKYTETICYDTDYSVIRTINYEYDEDGNLYKKIVKEYDEEIGGIVTMEILIDADGNQSEGNITSIIKPDGNTITETDGDGNKIKETVYTDETCTTVASEQTFFANGNPEKLINYLENGVTETIEYSESESGKPTRKTIKDGDTTTQYEYTKWSGNKPTEAIKYIRDKNLPQGEFRSIEKIKFIGNIEMVTQTIAKID